MFDSTQACGIVSPPEWKSVVRNGGKGRHHITSKAVRQLMDLWTNDPKFRTKLKSNPDSAVRDAGIQLTKEERTALKNVDWSLSDEELQARASKVIPN